ncbi:MAG TPA: multicopper oxidase domain-containing protein [Longimicrobium sp.]
MRVPVALSLAVPVLVVGGGIAVYSFSRPVEGQTRTYYIAADEVTYGPAGQGDAQAYRTAVYQEYTDGTFTQVKPRPAEWKHLAFLGPLIRADVGDTVRVVFRNRLAFPANVHPDAVLHHASGDEQDALSAATAGAAGLGADSDLEPVAPGATRVYSWAVPRQAGPGPDDHGSVLWLYHSRTGQPTGGEAGLIGPMLVYKRGALH